MTREAARDGLPLAAVFADLRLVMDLEPTDEVPAELLRACAVAWSQMQQELSAGPGAVGAGTVDDLESRLWAFLGRPDHELPLWMVIVAARNPPPVAPTTLFGPEDRLRLAAHLLAGLLDHADDSVMLLRDREDGELGRVVALATGVSDRVDDAVGRVRALATVGAGLAVTVHRLDAHPGGVLASLRESLGASS